MALPTDMPWLSHLFLFCAYVKAGMLFLGKQKLFTSVDHSMNAKPANPSLVDVVCTAC